MRRAHTMSALKGNGKHPRHVLTFDVETRPATCSIEYGPVKCPACIRIDAGMLTDEDEINVLVLGVLNGEIFLTIDEFWDRVESLCVIGDTVWLVNHNIAFDLMVLDWDASLVARGWTASMIIIPEPTGPFAVTWEHPDGRVLKMANLANWWGMRPLRSIGAIVGADKGDVDPTSPRYRHAVHGSVDWDMLARYCVRDADIVRRALDMWMLFLVDHDLGPFAITQAGQALNAYRHRFMNHKIFIHTNEKALILERESYLGGRTQAFRLGSYEGSFHVVDVNSLYPYVMAENTYPTGLRGCLNDITVDDLSLLVASGDRVIARVAIDTDDPVVPVRRDGRLIYPIGTFTATLCTPELAIALDAGIVTNVDEIAIYDSDFIFKEYVRELYDLRMRYHSDGNLVWYEIVKVFLNSLYGKFGQHNHQWEQEHGNIHFTPGTHTVVDAQTGERHTYRQLGGILARKSTSRIEGNESFPAIAAHVTSYARTHISRLREVAGHSEVYYCDTDSLFVTDKGLSNLSDYIDGAKLGYLKLETSAFSLNIRGLKDYVIGNKIKLKGIRRNALAQSDGSYRQVQFRGIAGALRDGEPGRARIGSIVKKPTGRYLKGTRGSDGWVAPLVLA